MSAIGFEHARLVHMDRGTRQWVSVKVFRIDPGASTPELLAALLAHRQYRDHYAGGLPEEQGEHRMHGPYRLECITLDSFRPIETEGAVATVRGWAAAGKPVSAGTQRDLDMLVYPALATPELYELSDLHSTAEHDWGWVVGHLAGFHELIAIDRIRCSLALLVASDD